jgi:hypothetical protein
LGFRFWRLEFQTVQDDLKKALDEQHRLPMQPLVLAVRVVRGLNPSRATRSGWRRVPKLPKRWKLPEWSYAAEERARHRTTTIGLLSIIGFLVIARIALWASRTYFTGSFAHAIEFLSQ